MYLVPVSQIVYLASEVAVPPSLVSEASVLAFVFDLKNGCMCFVTNAERKGINTTN